MVKPRVVRIAQETTAVYVHSQSIASATWVIAHNLGFHPSVTTVTSAGDTVEGDLHYDSVNQVTVTFANASGGFAYLS